MTFEVIPLFFNTFWLSANINFDMAFGAYKILRSTKTVDVIPAFDELIYFLIIFAESRVEVNIC